MRKKDFLEWLIKKSPKELVALRKKFRDELFWLRMKNKLKNLKETHQIKQARVKIAQVNTVLSFKINQTYGSIGE